MLFPDGQRSFAKRFAVVTLLSPITATGPALMVIGFTNVGVRLAGVGAGYLHEYVFVRSLSGAFLLLPAALRPPLVCIIAASPGTHRRGEAGFLWPMLVVAGIQCTARGSNVSLCHCWTRPRRSWLGQIPAGSAIPRSQAMATAILLDAAEHDCDVVNVIIFSGKIGLNSTNGANRIQGVRVPRKHATQHTAFA